MNFFDGFQFMFPPKQTLSLKHRMATRIWRGITNPKQNFDICQCCSRKVGKQQVESKCIHNSSQYSFLGPGIPLFFKFLKYSVVFLLILTLIFSIYGLYSNSASNNCQSDPNCVKTVFNSISIINKKDNLYLMRIQNYILLVFVIVCIFIFQWYRYMFRQISQKIDQIDVSASDYSIILKRLPQDSTNQDIKQMIDEAILSFKHGRSQTIKKTNIIQSALSAIQSIKPHQHNNNQQFIKNQKQLQQIDHIKVQGVVFSYDLTEYINKKQQLIENCRDQAERMIEWKQQMQDRKKEVELLANNNQFTETNYQSSVTPQKLIQTKPEKPEKTAQIAIVYFEQQQSKKYFLHEPNLLQRISSYFFTPYSPLSYFKVKGQYIGIQRAPQPDDIIWQNCHYTPWDRLKRKVLLNLASIILLIGGGICQYFLAFWQTTTQNSQLKVYVGTIASIVVTITNLILQQFLIFSTKWEKMHTYTQYLDILTFKLILQQFLNSGVFVVLANILANLGTSSIVQSNLAQTITQIMILNAITPNVTVFFMNKFDLIKRIQRYLFIDKQLVMFLSQQQANKLYQLPKPDFTQKYSYIVKTLWLTSFYAPFAPIVIPISAIGLTLNYFVQKMLFSSSYSISNKISDTLNNNCIQGLQYIPLILSIGQFLIYIYFEKILYKVQTPYDWLIPIYACLAISFVNLALPMKEISESIQDKIQNWLKEKQKEEASEQSLQSAEEGKLKSKDQKITYFQALQKFQIAYEMTNPAYDQKRPQRKDTAIQRRVQQLAQSIVKQNNLVNMFGFLGNNKRKSPEDINQQGIVQQHSNHSINLKANSREFMQDPQNINNHLKISKQVNLHKEKQQQQQNQMSNIWMKALGPKKQNSATAINQVDLNLVNKQKSSLTNNNEMIQINSQQNLAKMNISKKQTSNLATVIPEKRKTNSNSSKMNNNKLLGNIQSKPDQKESTIQTISQKSNNSSIPLPKNFIPINVAHHPQPQPQGQEQNVKNQEQIKQIFDKQEYLAKNNKLINIPEEEECKQSQGIVKKSPSKKQIIQVQMYNAQYPKDQSKKLYKRKSEGRID